MISAASASFLNSARVAIVETLKLTSMEKSRSYLLTVPASAPSILVPTFLKITVYTSGSTSAFTAISNVAVAIKFSPATCLHVSDLSENFLIFKSLTSELRIFTVNISVSYSTSNPSDKYSLLTSSSAFAFAGAVSLYVTVKYETIFGDVGIPSPFLFNSIIVSLLYVVFDDTTDSSAPLWFCATTLTGISLRMLGLFLSAITILHLFAVAPALAKSRASNVTLPSSAVFTAITLSFVEVTVSFLYQSVFLSPLSLSYCKDAGSSNTCERISS